MPPGHRRPTVHMRVGCLPLRSPVFELGGSSVMGSVSHASETDCMRNCHVPPCR